MKFKGSAVLAISLMFTITNCVSFAEIGNSDIKTVKSIAVSENNVLAPEVVAPEVVAPEVVAPEVVAPEVVAPEVVAPEVVAPEVVAPPEVVVPEVVVPELPVIGEVVNIEDQLVALAPGIKAEATLCVVTRIKGQDGAEDCVYEDEIVGLFEGDKIDTSNYIHENDAIKTITAAEIIELKEGQNKIIIDYKFSSENCDNGGLGNSSIEA